MWIHSCTATDFRLVYPDWEDFMSREYTIAFRGRWRPLNEYCIDMTYWADSVENALYSSCTNDRHVWQMTPTEYDEQYLWEAWVVTVEVDVTDELTDEPVYVVAWSVSEYVAWFNIAVSWESAYIENLNFGWNAESWDFADLVNVVELYNEVWEIIGSVNVGNWDSVFLAEQLALSQWNNKIYVKLITDTIGNNDNWATLINGTLSLLVWKAYSHNDFIIDISYPNSDNAYDIWNRFIPYSENSLPFSIVPVAFSDVEFVTSAAWISVNTNTTDANNVNLAILKLTASDRQNTDRNNGSDLQAIVSRLSFETSNPIDVSNYEIRRIWNSSINYQWSLNGNRLEFNLWLSDLYTREFQAWEVGYYVIRGDVQAGPQNNSSVTITMENLNGWSPESISYSPSDSTTEIYDSFRIGIDSIESPSVSIDNN
jgi:hypothetical protein